MNIALSILGLGLATSALGGQALPGGAAVPVPPVPEAPALGGGVLPSVPGRGGGGQQAPPTAESLVRVDVVATEQRGSDEQDRLGPELAVVFRIEPGWHIYWRNPGDSGMAPSIRLSLPEGWSAGEIQWPAPRAFVTSEERTFGYEGNVALFIPLRAPTDWASEVAIRVDCRWMVCRSICLTGAATREVVLLPGGSATSGPSTSGGRGGDPQPSAAPARIHDLDPVGQARAIAEASRARLPRPLDSARVTVDLDPDARSGLLRIRIGPVPDGLTIEQIGFFPEDTPGVDYGRPQLRASGPDVELRVPLSIDPTNALGQPLRAAAVLTIPSVAGDGSQSGSPGRILSVDRPLAKGGS